jgi:hypothetical protein
MGSRREMKGGFFALPHLSISLSSFPFLFVNVQPEPHLRLLSLVRLLLSSFAQFIWFSQKLVWFQPRERQKKSFPFLLFHPTSVSAAVRGPYPSRREGKELVAGSTASGRLMCPLLSMAACFSPNLLTKTVGYFCEFAVVQTGNSYRGSFCY